MSPYVAWVFLGLLRMASELNLTKSMGLELWRLYDGMAWRGHQGLKGWRL